MSSPSLIDELRGGATEVAPGEFTLDREQARAKLRQFQLADPRRYVLFLVEAAVWRGATRVDFAIDADDVRCSFDGVPFTAHDFEELYGSLFVGAEDDATRSRRALALGLNAAMALNPRWIRIDTGDGAGGRRLELRADRPDVVGEAPEPVTGTRIHVKSRFRAGLAAAFVRNLAGAIAEERWLRSHARFARTPITLDGKPVSFGAADPLLTGGLGGAPVEGPGLAGVVSFDPGGEGWFRAGVHDGTTTTAKPTRIGLLCAGVLVAWHEPAGPLYCTGVVDCRDFRRDASQSDIVRDAAFERAMSAVWEAGDAALAAAVDHIPFDEPGAVASRCRAAIRDALRRRRDWYVGQWNVGRALDATSAGLARAPVWRTVRGAAVTTAQLLAAVTGGGTIRYATDGFPELPAGEGHDVLELPDRLERELLESLFTGRTADHTRELRQVMAREAARQRFLGRRAEAVLPLRAGHQVVEPLRGEGVTGEVAVGGSQQAALVRFVVDGCLLAEKRVDLPFVAPPYVLPVDAVLVGAFAPSGTYDDVVADTLLGRAAVALLAGLERAIRRLCIDGLPVARFASDPRRNLVLPWLRGALDLDQVRAVLLAFGASEAAADRVLPLSLAAGLRPRLGVGRLPGDGPGGDGVHPAARVAIFERVGGPPVDLAAVDAEIGARGRVAYLTGQPLVGSAVEGLLLVPSPAELAVLRLVFGGEVLHDATTEWLARQREAVHERLLPETLGPDPRGFEFVAFEGAGLEGRLTALLVPAGAAGEGEAGPWRPMQLRILRRGRYLGERPVAMIAGPLAATVDGAEVRANATWTNVDDAEFVARAHAAAAAALVPLVERLGLELPRMPAGRREVAEAMLLEAACAPFPAPVFADAWAALRSALTFDEARSGLLRLLGHVGPSPVDEVEAAVSLALEAIRGDGASAAALPERAATCLARGDGPAPAVRLEPAVAAWLAAAEDDPVWPMPGALRRTVLFRSLGELPVSLGQVTARLMTGERVGWVAQDVPPDADGDALTLRLDAAAAERLGRALGPARLADRTAETRRRQRLRRLEAVPRLERIGLGDGEALLAEPLVGEGFSGEVGLAAAPEAGPSVLTICADRRPVAVIEGFSPLALRAVVNDDNLQLAAGTTELAAGEAERLGRLCEQSVPVLVEALAGRWAGLDEARRAVAWRHLLEALAVHAPAAGGRLRKESRPLVRAASAVPGFRTHAGGRLTLVELRRLVERVGGVFTVPPGTLRERLPALGLTTTPDTSYLVEADEWEEERLRRLFPRVLRWLSCPEEWRQAAQFRAELRPLPDLKPVAKLVKTKLSRDGLTGQLFLPTDPAVPLEASFGCAGLELGRGLPTPLLPCAGVLLVPEAALSSVMRGGWSAAALTPEQRTTLERAAVQLYRMLLAGRFDQPDAADERVRDLLADAALRLQRAAAAAGGQLKGDVGVLLRDLKAIPLVRRGSKRVRLDKLLRSRPPDLEPLGLWPAAAAPVEAAGGPEREGGEAADAPGAGAAGVPGAGAAAAAVPVAWPVVAEPETAERRAERFLDRLAEELERVWPKGDRQHVGRAALVLEPGSDERPVRYGTELVALQGRHPLVRAAIEAPAGDPVPLWLLVSLLATQANLDYARVTDEHEREVQLALVERLAAAGGPEGG
jgi:hypothetical protein